MIDLHMHSRYSDDGEFTPAQLVEKCTEQGIGIMSVTDHNCVKANEEAEYFAGKRGIRYIPGIEIDCTYEGVNFHVLGYGIDYHSGDFEQIEKKIDSQNARASHERLEKVKALGFSHLTKEQLEVLAEGNYWKGNWPGEMIAEALLTMPEYVDHLLLKPYRPGGERDDNPYVNFYWDYCAQGKPCDVRMDYPAMKDMITVIHRNHGAAVLAHPGNNLKGREYLLEGILGMGMDGIEVFSNYHSPEQVKYFYQAAQENKVLMTCGSDYHGKTKPSVFIGKHACFLSDSEMEAQLKNKLPGIG